MNCHQFAELLPEYALGDLSGPEAELVRAHLQEGCPKCVGRLAEIDATLSLLPLSLPLESPPAVLLDRLRKRIASPGAPSLSLAGNRGAEVRPRRGLWIGPLIGAAIAALLILAVGGPSYLAAQRGWNSARDQLAARQQEVTDLRRTLASEEETLGAIRSPAAAVISLTAPASPARGRIFLDAARGQWWFASSGLAPLPKGKTYQFWLIPRDQKPIPAGTFDVSSAGVGYLTGSVPKSTAPLAVAAITDEPTGGLPQPSGSIRLSAPLTAQSK